MVLGVSHLVGRSVEGRVVRSALCGLRFALNPAVGWHSCAMDEGSEQAYGCCDSHSWPLCLRREPAVVDDMRMVMVADEWSASAHAGTLCFAELSLHALVLPD
jgi:hypothetical protein